MKVDVERIWELFTKFDDVKLLIILDVLFEKTVGVTVVKAFVVLDAFRSVS